MNDERDDLIEVQKRHLAELRDQNQGLRDENERLREENDRLRIAKSHAERMIGDVPVAVLIQRSLDWLVDRF
jgi:regulator of replication initiation timing